MTLHIDLPPEVERRIVEEAARRGQQPAELARQLLEERLAPRTSERAQRAIALLDQWDAEDAGSGQDAGAAPVIPPLIMRGATVA